MEELFQPEPLIMAPIGAADESDPFSFQRRDQVLIEQAILLGHQFGSVLVDSAQQLIRCQAIGSHWRRGDLHPLLETRYADFEEFVQVGGGDTQELEALQQWHRLVGSLVQHTPIKLKLRQLAIYVVVGKFKIQGVHGPLGDTAALGQVYASQYDGLAGTGHTRKVSWHSMQARPG